jgi:hypothetical protein
MQRTKEKKETVVTSRNEEKVELVRWINHGGPFYSKNRIRVAPGETFQAALKDIPVAFRDVIRPADPVAVAAMENRPLQPVKSSFRLRNRADTSFFDILDERGKRINEKDLTEPEAKQVLSMLV